MCFIYELVDESIMPKKQFNIAFSEINLRNEQIFKSMFETYFPKAYQFAGHIISDEMVCDDIVQDSFLYMWQKNPQFNDEITFKSYLYFCVKNRCLNYIRNHKMEVKSDTLQDILYDESRLDHLMIEQELKSYILEHINQLPEMKRNVMLLRLEGNSYEQISEELSLSINTVKSHKKQAYKELKITLSNYRRYMILIVLLVLI